MRDAIKQIIERTGCTEAAAEEIEATIDEYNLLDWSECTVAERNEAIDEAQDICINKEA